MFKRKEILEIFAQNLRAERARKYYSQEYLAEKANISQEYLSRLESATYAASIVVVANLALALNITVDKLIPLEKYISQRDTTASIL